MQQQIQFSPGIYELYDRDKLLKSEHMDFQTHLYKFGEMENYLREAGFTEIKTYSSFEKEIAIDDCCDMFCLNAIYDISLHKRNNESITHKIG